MTAVPPPAGLALPPAPVRPRPVQALGTAVVVLGAAVVAAGLLRLVGSWMVHRVLFVEEGEFMTLVHRLDTPMLLVLVSGFLLVPALLATAVTTLVWVHRARTNAEALSPGMLFRHSPAASVGLLLVPVAGIWFLRTVLQDICAGSSPWGRDERGAALIRTYWVTTVATTAVALVGNVVLALVTAALYGGGRTVDESLNTAMATVGIVFATGVHLMTTACAVLFALVVRHVTARQTAVLFPPAARW